MSEPKKSHIFLRLTIFSKLLVLFLEVLRKATLAPTLPGDHPKIPSLLQKEVLPDDFFAKSFVVDIHNRIQRSFSPLTS